MTRGCWVLNAQTRLIKIEATKMIEINSVKQLVLLWDKAWVNGGVSFNISRDTVEH